MRELIEFKSVPNIEKCIELGEPEYEQYMKKASYAYFNQLKRTFNDIPIGSYFQFAENYSMFRTSYAISFRYNGEYKEHIDYIINSNIKNGCNEWDEEAIIELGKEFIDYINKNGIINK